MGYQTEFSGQITDAVNELSEAPEGARCEICGQELKK